MSIYRTTSAEVVIAQVLSKTKLTDMTYADDILVWLGEAINLLKTRSYLEPTHKILDSINNIVDLPCGLQKIDGVVYNGCRLRMGLGVTDARVMPLSYLNQSKLTTYFSDTSDPAYYPGQEIELLRGADITAFTTVSPTDYYIPYPNHLQTSFNCGKIILFYRTIPTDNRGYPIIPDHEEYRLACFWYIMAWLSFSGYKHAESRMDFDYCMEKFEAHGKKAKYAARAWSMDKKEAYLNFSVNLIPPRGYYECFSINAEQPRPLNI